MDWWSFWVSLSQKWETTASTRTICTTWSAAIKSKSKEAKSNFSNAWQKLALTPGMVNSQWTTKSGNSSNPKPSHNYSINLPETSHFWFVNRISQEYSRNWWYLRIPTHPTKTGYRQVQSQMCQHLSSLLLLVKIGSLLE